MIEQINDCCFDRYCADLQELNINGKKVFVFASHSTAIRAWYKQSMKNALNLITFDEHTDTFPPLLRYRNSHLDRTDKKLIELIDKIKAEISDETLHKLLLSERYLRSARQNKGYFGKDIACRLWHDEHITTAMMLGIINEAFICCHTSDDPSDNIDSERVSNLYNNIHYLDEAFDTDTILPDKENDCPEALRELGYIRQLGEKNISDERLKTLFEAGLQTEAPFVLDIDLDYFRDISVLNNPLDSYKTFASLVKQADCITIATEPDCVKEASDGYNYNVKDYNAVCKKENSIPYHHWDSQEVLMKLLKIIEYCLKIR